jgi:GNAT superfamily N-acetyltransferase
MQDLRLQVRPAAELTPALSATIIALCQRAYEEDVAPLFATFEGGTHVLGFLGAALAAHAMWVTRWLQPGDGPRLRTAYVEMVATEPRWQRRGFGAAVMRRTADAIGEYDLGALCPAETSLYARLGWAFWRGPLFIRSSAGLIPTPEERVMILRTSHTPALDLDQSLSAEWRAGELW